MKINEGELEQVGGIMVDNEKVNAEYRRSGMLPLPFAVRRKYLHKKALRIELAENDSTPI